MTPNETAEQAFDRWMLETEVSMSLSRFVCGEVVWPAIPRRAGAWQMCEEYREHCRAEMAELITGAINRTLDLPPGVELRFDRGTA